MFTRLLLVGLGGFFGAAARYVISGWAQTLTSSSFPLGTLVVNVAGSFFLAFFAFLTLQQSQSTLNARLFFLTGVLGAFTTYSTFSYETLQLIRKNLHNLYVLNVVSNTVLSLTGAWLGFTLARIIKG